MTPAANDNALPFSLSRRGRIENAALWTLGWVFGLAYLAATVWGIVAMVRMMV